MSKSKGYRWLLAGLLLPASALVARPVKAQPEHEIQGSSHLQFRIPEAIEAEHSELLAELARATHAGGEVGEAAKAVAALLRPHFAKEEEFALPPLGILKPLAEGRVTPDMSGIIAISAKLKAQLPDMLNDHRKIVAALTNLEAAARRENKPEYTEFAHKLALHAQTEEEITYPAAILAGEYVKLKLQR